MATEMETAGEVGLAWPRLVAIRAAWRALEGPLDDAGLRLKEAERKAREADQAWSALIDTIGSKEFDVRKAAADRRSLKALRSHAARCKNDVNGLKSERSRLDALFLDLFDRTVAGPGLFDGPLASPGGSVLAVPLSDVLPESEASLCSEAGLAVVGDVVELVRGKKGVKALPGKRASQRAVGLAVVAALKAARAEVPEALASLAPEPDEDESAGETPPEA